MWDIAVVGAGMAGLVCAQRLHQAGYRVLVLEKSRGLGGRAATRRLEATCVDHGLPYLETQGELTQSLIGFLIDHGIAHPWSDGSAFEWNAAEGLVESSPAHRYIVQEGMNTLGKSLAVGLEVWRGQRVIAIEPTPSDSWMLTLDSLDGESSVVNARAIAMATPAPQAEALLATIEPAQPEAIARLHQVLFDPCICAIALYPSDLELRAPLEESWQSIQFTHHPELSWLSHETKKRHALGQTSIVLQSTAAFAQRYLETSALPEIGMQLLQIASAIVAPELANPTLLQVHRWRYARPKTPCPETCLSFEFPMPLTCCGDWAGGLTLETALQSGAAAAEHLNQRLDQVVLPEPEIWHTLKQVDSPTVSL